MQSAMNALNPMKSIGAQFRDTLDAHEQVSAEDRQKRSVEALELVGIDPIHLDSYPHQLSGGMRQRAMIAMALLFTPQLVVMDEPTSALDVVAQRSLMTKIRDLQQTLGFAVIFVTHDMSVVSRYSDRVLVMYAGQIAEAARTESIFGLPQHPYTRGLISAFPSITGPRRELAGIPGAPPDLGRPPRGCRFHPRCQEVMPECASREPELYPVGDAKVRCLLYAQHATGMH
jgi:peptide/nickel transport system ATP-binding protein